MPDWAQRGARQSSSTWLLAALIALCSWPSLQTAPEPGLEGSWATALNMAVLAHLDFGTEIVFTFGPLGFLLEPQVLSAGTAVIGVLYLAALQLTLCFTLLWAARRSFPLPLAVLLAFVAASLIPHGEQLTALAFLWCAIAVAPSPPGFARPVVVYGGGAAAAVAVLFKLNTGVTVLLLVAVAAVALDGDRRRNLLACAGTFLASLTVLWFAAGQGIGNVADYVATGAAITSGYSEAMSIELPKVPWYRAAAILEVLAAAGVAVYAGLRLPRFRQIALVALVLIFLFAQFKNGLVRNDGAHAIRLFSAALLPWLAIQWSAAAERAVALAAIGAITLVFFPLTDRGAADAFTPVSSADAAVTDMRTLLDPAERAKARERARSELADTYRLGPRTLALVRGEGVHAYPWEASLVWAYDLDWQPLPVFQSYAVFTSSLDELNAEALESDRGPSRIIRTGYAGNPFSLAIDGRYAPFDAPAQNLAIFCRYRPLRTTPYYEVLARAAGRCGEPTPLGTVEAAYGEPIPVPRPPGPNRFVVARVAGLEPSGIERLRTLLYRSAFRYVVLNGYRARLVPGTADDLGLILRVTPGLDYPPPFAISAEVPTIVFLKSSEAFSPSGELTVEFFALRARASWR